MIFFSPLGGNIFGCDPRIVKFYGYFVCHDSLKTYTYPKASFSNSMKISHPPLHITFGLSLLINFNPDMANMQSCLAKNKIKRIVVCLAHRCNVIVGPWFSKET